MPVKFEKSVNELGVTVWKCTHCEETSTAKNRTKAHTRCNEQNTRVSTFFNQYQQANPGGSLFQIPTIDTPTRLPIPPRIPSVPSGAATHLNTPISSHVRIPGTSGTIPRYQEPPVPSPFDMS